MNKYLYRLVWNHALGLIQVVSELVKRSIGGAPAQAGASTVAVRPVSFGLWLAFGWIGVASVASASQVGAAQAAQIAADRLAPGDQRPTIMGAPQTAPLINITTPSKAGVSVNKYSAFNVDSHGAVLNNSRTPTQTQLAGSIAGNPWLATGTAKVILNEVTGSNPATLNGFVEVAGDRAQVVIASPAGIACDGCGFINANRVTLTTGTPVLSGGSLESYRVTRGAIQVSGKGLDASRADYADLIARSMQINAGVWAPQLTVTTGANDVSADHAEVKPISAGDPATDKPAFALDVSALGGMYANKIVLLGTEQGVGVRNAGTLGASAGELRVTVDGRIENTGAMQSQADTQISTQGGLANQGTVSATRELSITTPADVDNTHGTLNAGRIAVDAGALRNAGGTIAQTGTQAMSLQAGVLSNNGGRIGAPVMESDNGSPSGSPATGGGGTQGAPNAGDAGAVSPGGDAPIVTPLAPLADGVLRIAGTLDNDGGEIRAASGVDISAASGLANDGGKLSLHQLTLTGGDFSNRGGQLTIEGAARVHANTLINDSGQLTFNGPLTLDTQSLSNRGGTLNQVDAGATTFNVAGTFDNTDGTLSSNASSLDMASGSLINTRGRLLHAGADGFRITTNALDGAAGTIATAGAMQLTAGTVNHRDATLTATQVTVNAQNLDNRGGSIIASGDQANAFTASGTFDNGAHGTIHSNGDLAIAAAALGNAGGVVEHAGTGALRMQADTLNGHGGSIRSNGALTLAGNTLDLSGGTTSGQQVAIVADSLSTAYGSLIAGSSQPLTLTVHGNVDNTQGTVSTQGTLQLSAASLANMGGSIVAAGSAPSQVRVTDTFNNSGGMLATKAATTIHSGSVINQGGTLQTVGSTLTGACSTTVSTARLPAMAISRSPRPRSTTRRVRSGMLAPARCRSRRRR